MLSNVTGRPGQRPTTRQTVDSNATTTANRRAKKTQSDRAGAQWARTRRVGPDGRARLNAAAQWQPQHQRMTSKIQKMAARGCVSEEGRVFRQTRAPWNLRLISIGPKVLNIFPENLFRCKKIHLVTNTCQDTWY